MMPIVPTTLVRITRVYLLTALAYLVLTLALSILAAAGGTSLLPALDANLFWYIGVLGWVSLPVMGAFYQFFPTLQGEDLHAEKLTFLQYGLINLGLIGILGSLLIGNRNGLGLFTTIYALGAFLLAFILLGRNTIPSKVTLSIRFFMAAVVYLLAGVTILTLNNLGLASLGRQVVSHLLLIGWAVMAVFGAQYIMLPMLQLKTLAWESLAKVQFFVANLGVIGLAWGFVRGGTPFIAGGGAVVFLASVLFVAVIWRSVTTGPSRLPKLDISVKFFLAGDAHLVLVSFLGIVIALLSFNLRTVHLHLALIGVLTNVIIGAMYHILPFLVWWETYAGKVGLEQVPLLKELFNESFANFSFYAWNISLWVMIAGFLFAQYYVVALAGVVELILAAILLGQMLNLVARRKSESTSNQPKDSAMNLTASGGI